MIVFVILLAVRWLNLIWDVCDDFPRLIINKSTVDRRCSALRRCVGLPLQLVQLQLIERIILLLLPLKQVGRVCLLLWRRIRVVDDPHNLLD
ncbi:hypothetical protein D3C80_1829640 [compost metagenome]